MYKNGNLWFPVDFPNRKCRVAPFPNTNSLEINNFRYFEDEFEFLIEYFSILECGPLLPQGPFFPTKT